MALSFVLLLVLFYFYIPKGFFTTKSVCPPCRVLAEQTYDLHKRHQTKMEVGICTLQCALPGTSSAFPFLPWQLINRLIHKYLRISKQQTSSSWKISIGASSQYTLSEKSIFLTAIFITMVAILLLQVQWSSGWLITNQCPKHKVWHTHKRRERDLWPAAK